MHRGHMTYHKCKTSHFKYENDLQAHSRSLQLQLDRSYTSITSCYWLLLQQLYLALFPRYYQYHFSSVSDCLWPRLNCNSQGIGNMHLVCLRLVRLGQWVIWVQLGSPIMAMKMHLWWVFCICTCMATLRAMSKMWMCRDVDVRMFNGKL